MFIDSGRILGVLGKEPPLMTTREELKVEKLEMNGESKSLKVVVVSNQFGKTISIQYCYCLLYTSPSPRDRQ